MVQEPRAAKRVAAKAMPLTHGRNGTSRAAKQSCVNAAITVETTIIFLVRASHFVGEPSAVIVPACAVRLLGRCCRIRVLHVFILWVDRTDPAHGAARWGDSHWRPGVGLHATPPAVASWHGTHYPIGSDRPGGLDGMASTRPAGPASRVAAYVLGSPPSPSAANRLIISFTTLYG